MHENIEKILLNNINQPQYRKTWKEVCKLLNHLIGLHCLNKDDRDLMETYWHMLFIQVSGEKHLKEIEFQQRCVHTVTSKLVESKGGCNDN